jgi:hypothetical protein
MTLFPLTTLSQLLWFGRIHTTTSFEGPIMGEPHKIPEEIQSTLVSWQRKAIAWESLHYTLGVAALLLLPLTHVLSEQGPEWRKSPLLHMACAANLVFVALVTFLQPRTHSRFYWQAYYRLHAACLYFLGHHRASEDKIWDVWIEAERSLAQTEEQDQPRDLIASAAGGNPAPAGLAGIAPDSANVEVHGPRTNTNGHASAPEVVRVLPSAG